MKQKLPADDLKVKVYSRIKIAAELQLKSVPSWKDISV
jgi:hypothetical protein